MFFYTFLALLILQRIWELRIASQNRKWIIGQGGYEVGKAHYKWMVLLHSSFLLSLTIEYMYRSPSLPSWWWIPFLFFLTAQGIRYWAISTLGPYWNTRILILPDADIAAKGPYLYIRHPNYFVVIAEILSFPLLFGLFYTAMIFSILNLSMILYRISIEEQALIETTNYSTIMKKTPRFMPRCWK